MVETTEPPAPAIELTAPADATITATASASESKPAAKEAWAASADTGGDSDEDDGDYFSYLDSRGIQHVVPKGQFVPPINPRTPSKPATPASPVSLEPEPEPEEPVLVPVLPSPAITVVMSRRNSMTEMASKAAPSPLLSDIETLKQRKMKRKLSFGVTAILNNDELAPASRAEPFLTIGETSDSDGEIDTQPAAPAPVLVTSTPVVKRGWSRPSKPEPVVLPTPIKSSMKWGWSAPKKAEPVSDAPLSVRAARRPSAPSPVPVPASRPASQPAPQSAGVGGGQKCTFLGNCTCPDCMH